MLPDRTVAQLVLVAAATIATACSPAGVEPRKPTPTPSAPTIRFISGAGASDSIDALLSQRLIVEVHDSAGAPAPGVAVQFTTIPRSPSELREALLYPLDQTGYTIVGN